MPDWIWGLMLAAGIICILVAGFKKLPDLWRLTFLVIGAILVVAGTLKLLYELSRSPM